MKSAKQLKKRKEWVFLWNTSSIIEDRRLLRTIPINWKEGKHIDGDKGDIGVWVEEKETPRFIKILKERGMIGEASWLSENLEEKRKKKLKRSRKIKL